MKNFTTKLVLFLALLAMIFGAGATAGQPKLIRLTIINDSGDTVHMKLEATVGDAFYYFTVDPGDMMVYTIETDLYKRNTWACGNVNSGRLAATSNIRLKFTVCGQIPTKRLLAPNHPFLCKYNGATGVWQCPNFGEPTLEKVVYFKSVMGLPVVAGGCAGGVISFTFYSPGKGLCMFRYRY